MHCIYNLSNSLHLRDNISKASPKRFHPVRNPMFLTECADLLGNQVVVVARHGREQA